MKFHRHSNMFVANVIMSLKIVTNSGNDAAQKLLCTSAVLKQWWTERWTKKETAYEKNQSNLSSTQVYAWSPTLHVDSSRFSFLWQSQFGGKSSEQSWERFKYVLAKASSYRPPNSIATFLNLNQETLVVEDQSKLYGCQPTKIKAYW